MSKYSVNSDTKWFAEIGFKPCITRQGNNKTPVNSFDPDDGYLLLNWDIERLDFLEKRYIARTGVTPPSIVRTREE